MMFGHADMHCHLDRFDDPRAAADAAARARTALFAVTTTPQDYLAARDALGDCANVRVGAGLHPWWLADGRSGEDDIQVLESLIPTTRFIGEIGLDFMEKHAPASSWGLQEDAFRRICAAAGSSSALEAPKVLSIHAVRAAKTVLGILRETGCLEACICILHWFSDSADLLWDAIRAGCWFSMGERSLRTGKGREYIKLIPHDRLLFETDTPWSGDAELGFAAIAGSLARAEAAAAAIVGGDAVRQARENAAGILSLQWNTPTGRV